MDVPTQVEGDDLFKEWFYQKAKLNCYSYVQGTHSWLEIFRLVKVSLRVVGQKQIKQVLLSQ